MKNFVLIALTLSFTINHDSYRREGVCTHYGRGYHLIRSGASGIKVNADFPIAASREIPYGAIVEVENIDDKSKCKGNKMRVMIFDMGPEADPDKRIFDMMPQGGFYSYKGRPGIAEKWRGGVKVRLTIVDMSRACYPERLGKEMRQAKGEYWCLALEKGNKVGNGYFMKEEDIFWDPYYEKNKPCNKEEKENGTR